MQFIEKLKKKAHKASNNNNATSLSQMLANQDLKYILFLKKKKSIY